MRLSEIEAKERKQYVDYMVRKIKPVQPVKVPLPCVDIIVVTVK